MYVGTEHVTGAIDQTKIYASTKNSNGVWSTPVPVIDMAGYGERITALYIDGRVMYIGTTLSNKNDQADIYKSTKNSKGGWSVPKLALDVSDCGDHVSAICIDGDTMYIGTEFNTDKQPQTRIYKSIRNRKGAWSARVPIIDIANCGMFIGAICIDGDAMYIGTYVTPTYVFQTNIYVSTRGANDTWSVPVVVPPLNTSSYGMAIGAICIDGNTMYVGTVHDASDAEQTRIYALTI